MHHSLFRDCTHAADVEVGQPHSGPNPVDHIDLPEDFSDEECFAVGWIEPFW
jgi:hypothetical protein